MTETLVRPAFEVHKIKGNVTRTMMQVVYETNDETGEVIRDDKGRKVYKGLEQVTTKEPFGYMVYFPQGHSIRCTESELRKYGLDKTPHMVDMETGERIVPHAATSLKDFVEGRARRTVAINLDELVGEE